MHSACVLCDARISLVSFLCQACSATLPENINACRGCALPLPTNSICGTCLQHPSAFELCFAPYHYVFPVDVLIKAVKFSQRLAYAQLFASLMYQQVARLQIPLPQCLIPVPLHRKRLFSRGYNQAVELAKPLARRLGIPLLHGATVRVRNTLPQANLAANARRANVHRAFQLKEPVRYQHVALVDDVMTTGHTARELAGLLRSGGVERVDVWAAARAYR
ncbi:MAG: ComF family protein [Gammaproteobacteria bacterium]